MIPGRYRHYKGGIYEVLGVARKLGENHFQRVTAECLGIFGLTENPGEQIYVFKSEEKLFYLSLPELGDRVIYVGQTGRWARRLDDFLSQTSDGKIRFVKLDNQGKRKAPPTITPPPEAYTSFF